MITRRENGHLVPIDRVVMEEAARLLVDLSGTILVAPDVEQFLVHGPRSQFGDFA